MEIKKFESSNGDGFNPLKAIVVIVVFIIIVWFIWMAVSKMSSSSSRKSASDTINVGNSSTPDKIPTTKAPLQDSFYRNYLKITNSTNAKETYADKENIEVRVVQANLSAVDISNWSLMNSKGEKTLIGSGVELPKGGNSNSASAIKIKGGDTLIISSGRSPIGFSFRVNRCVGYFEQFQDFIPALQTQCPQTSSNSDFNKLDRNCQTFARSIQTCNINTAPFPAGTSADCKAFIISKISYNGCVADNKIQTDFSKPEWRIYLGRNKELWALPKDTITLLDSEGKIVDTISYGK